MMQGGSGGFGAVRSETFHWRFASPAEKIWTALADTERFNEAAELPRYRVTETPREDGGVDFLAEARIAGFDIAWREVPATWVSGRWFTHRREFVNGPFLWLEVTLTLTPEPAGQGCLGAYEMTVAARNWVGRAMLAAGFISRTKKRFDRMVAEADAFAQGAKELEFEFPEPKLQPGARRKLAAGVAAIEATPYGHGLAARLAEHVATRPEVDVRRIRPLELARRWRVEPRKAVEACLQAARQELLGLRWELLCPRCQSAKAEAPSLDMLPREAHCASCNIDYGRDYTRNVELAFFPSQSIRLSDDREFCLFGPMSTPHVALQIRVAPGERRAVEAEPAFGAYRLRTLEAGGAAEFEWQDGAFPMIVAEGEEVFAAPGGERSHVEPGQVEPGHVVFENRTPHERIFIVEELGWRRDALTADRATSLQAFRDLYDTEILRPGDHLEIDHVAFMFVDLRGSTALYERVGDAQAYALVRGFFAVLGGAIRAENGVLVKTIGDAVHAAFASPRDALACALRIRADIAEFNARSDKTPIGLKIGLHAGRSISVTLNSRLDYYGGAVNKAARLCDQSRDDIVLSEEFAADPGAAPLIAARTVQADSAVMKGFAAMVPFVRLLDGDSAGASAAE